MIFRISLVAGTLLCAGCAAGDDGDAMQALADSVRAVSGAPGVIVAVRSPGGVFRSAASGKSDLETGRPIQAGDAFRLGSVSKVYTAAVTLRLVEDGLLDLEEEVSRYFPGLPAVDGVTVRQLLDHTSGVRDFYLYLYLRPDRDEMVQLVTKRWTEEELLGLIARFGSSFAPGAEWSYSNANYYLLGVIIERVTGLTLVEALRTYLYEPLDLEGTWLDQHEAARLPLETTGYMGTVDGWKHSEMFGDLGPTTILDHSPVEWGAGGLVSTAAEATHFLSALMDGEILGADELAAMKVFRDTPRQGIGSAAEPTRPDGYGLGLIRMELPKATLWGHGGLFTGHTAGVWHVPACGATIAVYLNRGFVGQRDALGVLMGGLPTIDTELAACLTS